MNLKIESRIWIEKDGEPFLGKGRVKLLETIHKCGSISKAASELNMSYKKAWGLIKSMNAKSETPLVLRTTGGKNGGGSKITQTGKTIIKGFRELEIKQNSFLACELENYCF